VHPGGTPGGYRSPVILLETPYIAGDLRDMDLPTCASWLVDNFVPYGYAVALVPIRGTGASNACPDMMGPKERADDSQPSLGSASSRGAMATSA
jgi:predicted acyl esterase